MEQAFDGERAFIAPDVIIGMITENSKNCVDILNNAPVVLVTSDFALYEAIASIKKEELVMPTLMKFLLRVQIVPSPKISIDMSRIEHLRRIAKLDTEI
jgi:hypothetical protein